MPSRSSLAIAVACVAAETGVLPLAFAEVAVEPPFASHMVLQRDRANPVWGTARSGESVSVTIGDQTQTATASSDGQWKIMLEPMAAGGPLTMTIEGGNSITLSDVFVGEVWQAAGQSNMDTRLSYYSNLASEISAADLPTMRYFTVRQPGNPPTTWEVVSPSTAGDLSAMAYFFGKEILESTGVAVGLVVTAVGGTTIASWLDPATLAANPSITNDDRGTMWNEWVSPVVGYGIRGTIWIQGEQNCNGTDAPSYGQVFRLLIDGWRAAWGQGDFPFYYGQLSNIHSLQTDPNNTSDVATVREGQRMALLTADTAMSVNLDIGSADDWHFPNKAEAGRRLSLPARALVYGETSLVYSGPLYLSKTISGSEVTLHFDHVGGGLTTTGSAPLSGFAIAGATGNWIWGDAEIRGDVVVVSSPSVPSPTRVRYAWGDNPINSLYNAEGLPAASFTTESEDLPPTRVGDAGGASGAGGTDATGGTSAGGSASVGGSTDTGGTPMIAGANASGDADTGGVGSSAGSGGRSGVGGSSDASGTPASGGMTSAGGATSGNPVVMGGASPGLGGAPPGGSVSDGSGGSGGSGTGGALTVGGGTGPAVSGSSGDQQGHAPGLGGGITTSGGSSSDTAGGSPSVDGTMGGTASTTTDAGAATGPASSNSESGCGCRIAYRPERGALDWGVFVAIGLVLRVRRRASWRQSSNQVDCCEKSKT